MNKLEIAQAIEVRRRELGITKQELAYRCNTEPKEITQITIHPETKGYRIQTLLKILDSLGLELTFKIKEIAK
jgi:transcriptional regulator with XRE-family HTH domain